jgi:hypothetical protein
MPNTQKTSPWSRGIFAEGDHDPLASFANIMDVMLVFALGLMLALIAQSQELRAHFKLEKIDAIASTQELVEAPESIKKSLDKGGEGMESLGQVYRDAKTGKLILISSE